MYICFLEIQKHLNEVSVLKNTNTTITKEKELLESKITDLNSSNDVLASVQKELCAAKEELKIKTELNNKLQSSNLLFELYHNCVVSEYESQVNAVLVHSDLYFYTLCFAFHDLFPII